MATALGVVVLCLSIGIVPVALIQQRDVAAIIVPLLAVLVFVGISFEALCSGTAWVLARRFSFGVPTSRMVGIGLAVTLTALILLWQGGPERRMSGWAFSPIDLPIAPALAALKIVPPPGPGESFVIESDPFQSMQWSDCFLFRLYFQQPELQVKRREQVTDQNLSAGRWRHLTREDNRWKELPPTQ